MSIDLFVKLPKNNYSITLGSTPSSIMRITSVQAMNLVLAEKIEVELYKSLQVDYTFVKKLTVDDIHEIEKLGSVDKFIECIETDTSVDTSIETGVIDDNITDNATNVENGESTTEKGFKIKKNRH